MYVYHRSYQVLTTVPRKYVVGQYMYHYWHMI